MHKGKQVGCLLLISPSIATPPPPGPTPALVPLHLSMYVPFYSFTFDILVTHRGPQTLVKSNKHEEA